MSASHSRRRLSQYKDSVQQVLRPEGVVAEEVARVAFGVDTSIARGADNKVTAGKVLLGGVRMTTAGSHRPGTLRGYKRLGLSSHVQSVARACGRFLESADSVICTNSFDDASMWVKDTDSRMAKVGGKDSQMRSKNRTQACMSIVQHMVVRRASGLHASQLHAPTMPLPSSNWSTMFSRWSRWSWAFSAPHVLKVMRGSLADDVRRVSQLLTSVHFKGLILCKDSLIANECLVRALQDLRALSVAAAQCATLFDLRCHHHLGALVNRPVLTTIGGGALATNIVRLGHVLSSSTAYNRFLDKVASLVDEGYCYYQVDALPPAAASWRAARDQVRGFGLGSKRPKLASVLSTQVMARVLRPRRCFDDLVGEAPTVFWCLRRLGQSRLCIARPTACDLKQGQCTST